MCFIYDIIQQYQYYIKYADTITINKYIKWIQMEFISHKITVFVKENCFLCQKNKKSQLT